MSDLPPPLDDGELPFEAEYEKPKKRPPSRWWQKVLIPIPLLIAICALLVCSAVLLLSTSFANGSLLCKMTSLCAQSIDYSDRPILLHNDPSPPIDAVRVQEHRIYNNQTKIVSEFYTTATPAPYTMPRCDPNADYHNHILFTLGVEDNAELFLIAPDGTGFCRLTFNLIAERVADWSPDRTQILFLTQRSADTYTDLYAMNFDGSNIVDVTSDQETEAGGIYSPDGKQIAVTSGGTNVSDHIFVMNADGSDRYDLTPDASNAQRPTWSPDGSQIAYVAGSDEFEGLRLYIANVNTKVSRPLTGASLAEFAPDWSPDGQSLVFYAQNPYAQGKPQGIDLYELTLSSGHIQRLTSLGNAMLPAWSPDGRSIAFISNDGLEVLDLNSMQTRLLPTDGFRVQNQIVWR